MVSLFLKFCHSFDELAIGLCVAQYCTHNEHVGLLFGGHPILLITQITHQIGFYGVPLPLPVILYNQ